MFLNLLYLILFLMSQNLVQLNKMLRHKPKKKNYFLYPSQKITVNRLIRHMSILYAPFSFISVFISCFILSKYEVVSHWPLKAAVQIASQAHPCKIYSGQNGTGIGISPSTSVFPCRFLSTNAAYSYFIRLPSVINNLSN
jgi:hypothetical protein